MGGEQHSHEKPSHPQDRPVQTSPKSSRRCFGSAGRERSCHLTIQIAPPPKKALEGAFSEQLLEFWENLGATLRIASQPKQCSEQFSERLRETTSKSFIAAQPTSWRFFLGHWRGPCVQNKTFVVARQRNDIEVDFLLPVAGWSQSESNSKHWERHGLHSKNQVKKSRHRKVAESQGAL